LITPTVGGDGVEQQEAGLCRTRKENEKDEETDVPPMPNWIDLCPIAGLCAMFVFKESGRRSPMPPITAVAG